MSQYGNMYPGQQQAPQAPVAQPGGFDQTFAPPAQPFNPQQPPPGFIPAPQAYVPQPAQQVHPGYAPPQQQVHPGYAPPQQQVHPGYAPPQQQVYAPPQQHAQPAPVFDAAYEARMRQAAMGNGRRNPLPIGDYAVVVESSEVALVGPPQGRQLRVFFAHITVEQSSNPAIQPGHKAKLSLFLESDYDMDQAMGEFKAFVANALGVASEDELWARFPSWMRDVQSSPGPFVGVRLSGSVKQKVNKQKQLKFKPDGSPDLRYNWQRIG